MARFNYQQFKSPPSILHVFRAAVPRGEPVPVRVVLVAEPAQHQQPVPREGDVRRLVLVPRQRLPVLLPVSGLPHPASHHPAPSLGTQMDIT